MDQQQARDRRSSALRIPKWCTVVLLPTLLACWCGHQLCTRLLVFVQTFHHFVNCALLTYAPFFVLEKGSTLYVTSCALSPARSAPAWTPIVPVPHCRLYHTRMLWFYIFALLYITAERVGTGLGLGVGCILSGVQWTSLSRQPIATSPPPLSLPRPAGVPSRAFPAMPSSLRAISLHKW